MRRAITSNIVFVFPILPLYVYLGIIWLFGDYKSGKFVILFNQSEKKSVKVNHKYLASIRETEGNSFISSILFRFLCLKAYQPSWVFNAESILVKKRGVVQFNHSWVDKKIHTFPKSIGQKVGFELAYYDVTV